MQRLVPVELSRSENFTLAVLQSVRKSEIVHTLIFESKRDVASVERVEHLAGGIISVYKSILIRPKA